MKYTHEYNMLADKLKTERAGSVKIRAFADHAMLKEIAWKIEHLPTETSEHVKGRLEAQQSTMILIRELTSPISEFGLCSCGFLVHPL